MPKLEDIYPTKKYNVIDLVKEAGVDVSDWKNCSSGAKGASRNPKYCYEWSFIEPDEVVVLSLWHVDLKVVDNHIVYETNERKFANKKGQEGIWKKRALKMDYAFQYAGSNKLPIRVIICAGYQINDGKTSRVNRRVLDSKFWAVTKYDVKTGECVITRAVKPKKVIKETLTGYIPVAEEKICKICWNDDGWQYPSGFFGKSKDKDAYEYQFDYGTEEWLFDFDKLIDGYHYAFLQPVGKSRDAYIGNSYTMNFYSVRSGRANEYFWVARIENVEVIDRDVEEGIITLYKEYGWLEQMETDLKDCDADAKQFMKVVRDNTLFNVRFRPEDVQWFGVDPVQFFDTNIISNKRYRLIDKESDIDLLTKPGELQLSGKTEKEKHSGERSTKNRPITQCHQLHTDIQNSLCDYLKNKYPKDTVDMETGTGMGTNIDVVLVRGKGKPTFFEVKTYPSAKKSIREALGQLLEYAYYPSRVMAKELVIVTQSKISKHDEQYIMSLNTRFSIPIGYMQFDYKTGRPVYTYNCNIK